MSPYELRIKRITNYKWARYIICSLFIVCCSLFLVSCGNNPLDVDMSGIKVEPVKIQRFDQDFFSLNADNISQKLPELQNKYPGFTVLFVKNIVCPSGINDSACIPDITRFVNDKDMRGAFDNCQKVFPDMSSIETELTKVFRHYLYCFPEKKIPKVFAMMSGFNYSIANADSAFAIGLEMYLGKKSRFYDMMQIPNYKRSTMQKEYIVPDFIRACMINQFPNKSKSGTLLNEMIYQGKLLYLSDALFPDADDSLKIGFTKKQLDWCVEHENDMWGYLIKNKFLYSNEVEVISKFTGEGPFTTGFVKESPARTGVWMGWRIIKKYMNENPKTTLDQLMQEDDAQKILSMSKYKP